MLQERLNGLGILSIEKKMLGELINKNLTNNFESQKERKNRFLIKKINKYYLINI